MKLVILILSAGCWIAVAGETNAVVANPAEPVPEQSLGEVEVTEPLAMEKKIAPEDRWTEAQHGILGQIVEAPSPLAPLNPLASSEAGFGDPNLNSDTVTGRIMGLNLVRLEF